MLHASGTTPGDGRISMFGHEDPTRVTQQQQFVPRPQPGMCTHAVHSDYYYHYCNPVADSSDSGNTITDPEQAVRYYMEYIRVSECVPMQCGYVLVGVY